MTTPLNELGDGAERLSADDMASQREAEFLEAALRRHRATVAVPMASTGVCVNCRTRCLPQARFCDADCRADHEQRQRVLARQGLA